MLAVFMQLSVSWRVQGHMAICKACSVRPSTSTHNPAMHVCFNSMLWPKEVLLAKHCHVVLLWLWLHGPVAPEQTTCFCVLLMSKITATSGMQVERANQELWLVDRQPGSEDDDHRTVDTLAAELGWAMREQAEQQSEYSLELEYMERVITSLTPVVYTCIDLLSATHSAMALLQCRACWSA